MIFSQNLKVTQDKLNYEIFDGFFFLGRLRTYRKEKELINECQSRTILEIKKKRKAKSFRDPKEFEFVKKEGT